MSEEKKRKQREILRLQKRVDLIDQQLKLLDLIEDKEKELYNQPPVNTEHQATSDHRLAFPIGSTVRFTNKSSERPHLRGKSAKVIGHSPQRVKVERKNETTTRKPNNLIRVFDNVGEVSQEAKAKDQKGKKGGGIETNHP